MMNRRGMIFIGLALALGIAAARLSMEMVETPEAMQAELQTAKVVVVRTDVPVAASLTAIQLELVDWPKEHVPTGALTSIEQANGRVARRPFAAGEPVVELALFDMGATGGLRAVISPEKRAVSVKVDNVIGVAGFVAPGARVDVLATIRRVDLSKALPFSKVILQDVRVLAVDQKLEEVRSGDPELVNVVTLEVDPVQAEHLIYAAHEGRLQLALRGPGDDAVIANKSIGVADIMGDADAGQKIAKVNHAPRRSIVEVVNGSSLEIKKF